jgi:hypothetical protein
MVALWSHLALRNDRVNGRPGAHSVGVSLMFLANGAAERLRPPAPVDGAFGVGVADAALLWCCIAGVRGRGFVVSLLLLALCGCINFCCGAAATGLCPGCCGFTCQCWGLPRDPDAPPSAWRPAF